MCEARVPAGGAPRSSNPGSKERERCRCDGFSERKDSSAQGPSDTAARDAGLRDTLAFQFGDCADYGIYQRDLFAGAAGKGRAAGSSQGSAGTADADAGTDDTAPRGRTLGNSIISAIAELKCQ